MRKGNMKKFVWLTIFFFLFCVFAPAQAVFAAYQNEYGNEGGGGGGGGAVPPQTPTLVTNEVETPSDRDIDKSLRETGKAIVDISKNANKTASISGGTMSALINENKPVEVTSGKVTVSLDGAKALPESIKDQLAEGKSTLDIHAGEITEAEKEEILSQTKTGENTGVIEIAGVGVINVTAQIKTTQEGTTTSKDIHSFSAPIPITIDLSGLDLTPDQIANLGGARLVKGQPPVALPGEYNAGPPATFTLYTSEFSYYTVMEFENIKKIKMRIDDKVTLVNGVNKVIDVPPMIINSRTMVPLRYIGESFGAEFDWDETTKTVTFMLDGKTLKLIVDKERPDMDVPPTIRNGRTLVPVRFISESFGAQVMWFSDTKTVQIVKSK